MPYDAKAIGNYFLDLAEREGRPLDPIKLQKLVYFANGWNLALRDRPLLDEQIEAWSYGPVIPSLYQEFRRFGDEPIRARAMLVEFADDDDETGRVVYPKIDDSPEGKSTKNLLDRIWQAYRGYTSIQLSNVTHEEGTPWERVWKEYEGQLPRSTDIPPAYIKEYFLDLSRKSKVGTA
jgi:uncharacterized phage-associated protein